MGRSCSRGRLRPRIGGVVDQSQYSSPENAGNQPQPDASAPFAGNFPAPVGPPVQPAAVPPTAPRPMSALPPQNGNGFAPAPNGYPAPGGGFVTATVPGAPAVPSQAVPMPQSPAAMGAPRAHPAGHAGHVQGGSPTRGTEADTDLTGWDLNGLLIQVLERKCSDLHMTIGAPPTVRLNGSLLPIEGYPELTRSCAAEAALRDHHAEAARALRGRARARLRVLGARAGPASASTCTASATRSARPSA